MTSSIFSQSHPPIKPPSICKSLFKELPPILPTDGPGQLQGYATWVDLDPLGPLAISMYTPMSRSGAAWCWSGSKTVDGTRFIITLERLEDPNPWELTLDVWRTPTAHESFAWPTFALDTTGCWDTGILTHIVLPGKDYRTAQVML